MRKFGVFTSFILISALIAGLYGIIHDQITYSISPEYFTKFKYRQFGLDPSLFGGHRPTVAIIGFLATWWTGIFIGIGLGLTTLIYDDYKRMRAALAKGIGVVLSIAVLTGITGYFYGRFHLIKTGVNWWLPEDLIDRNSFITVGSIHNFSYIGGIIGLLVGIVFLIKTKSSSTPFSKKETSI
ncbi:MAG: hypothetical protein ABL872_09045 [Lacibacter sp.]